MASELFWKMNTEKAADDMAMGEKHAPVITIPDSIKAGDKFKVHVYVGGGKHPNLSEHHFEWLELYIDGLPFSRVDFAAAVMEPEVEFTLVCPHRPFGEISAVARCNMHGLWEAKVKPNIAS